MPHQNDGQLTVLAIDPGRSKCGLALVTVKDGKNSERSIVPTDQLVVVVSRLLRANPTTSIILIGSGTGSSTLYRALKGSVPTIPILLVDEQGTSLLARDRYLDEHPPKGWKRLVPRGLITPPEPYDDYAALILAERYIASTSNVQLVSGDVDEFSEKGPKEPD